MARFDYAKARRTAIRLFDKFGGGREVPMRLLTLPTGRAGLEPGPADRSVYEVIGVVLPASKGTIQAFDNRLEGGTLIDENLRFVMCSPEMKLIEGTGEENPTPLSLDELQFDGERWAILGNTPLKPSGITLLHRMGCRRI